MIAGLPWESWLLLLASIGMPLAIVIVFHRAHRSEATRPSSDRTESTEGPDS